MPMTNDFRKILRNEKRSNEDDTFFESAINKAFDKGIKPYRERKKTSRREKSNLFLI